MRRTYALAVLLAGTTMGACTTPAPTAPTSPAAPRLAEVLGAGLPSGAPPVAGSPPSTSVAPGRALREGAGPLPPQSPGPTAPTVSTAPPLTLPTAASAVPSGDAACRDARARRSEVAARLAEVRKTAGVAEALALDRASGALAACESRQDCVEGDPKERAARVMAVEEARAAFRKANASLQQEELALFDADRAVGTACGGAP